MHTLPLLLTSLFVKMQEIADVSQLQSEVLLFVRPQNKDRVSHWYKAYLKNNTILFQEAKVRLFVLVPVC